MDTTVAFTEARALNAIGLVTNPPTHPQRPHRVFTAILAAAAVGVRHAHLPTRFTSEAMIEVLEDLLTTIDFSEIELAEIFSFVAEQSGVQMDVLMVVRPETRAPFHTAMLDTIASSVRELRALSGLDPQSLDADQRHELRVKQARLKMTTRMLGEMVARADLGDARDETILRVEAICATLDEQDDARLMLTGIIVQQRRFAKQATA